MTVAAAGPSGIGLKYPGALAVGPDGAAYFFSGVHFYRQEGLGPPERISSAEIDQYVVDGQHFPTRACLHGTLNKMSLEDLVMCGTSLGRADLVLWTWGNNVVNNTADFYAMHDLGLFYSPALGRFSALNNPAFNSSLLSQSPIYPSATKADFSLDNAVGYIWDGASSYQYRLEGPQTMAATLTVKRQPMALNGAERPVKVAVRAVLPVFTTPAAAAFSAAPVAPAPANVTIQVTRSNEPHGVAQLDADGATVSPTVVSEDRATFADDWAWHNVGAVEGRWFDIGIDIPAGGGWRHFSGAFIDYAVLT